MRALERLVGVHVGQPVHVLVAAAAFSMLFVGQDVSPAFGAVAAVPERVATAGEAAGQIENPRGMAVDQSSGDLFVADGGNQRVDVFDSSGAFVRAFGLGVDTGADAVQTCTAATECRSGLTASSVGDYRAGSLSGPYGIAASAGEVWVSDGAHRVTEFDSSGNPRRIVGGDVVAYGPDNSGVDAVQKLTVKAEGGTFQLKLIDPFSQSGANAVTTPLASNASAAEVESALDALPTIGGLGGSVNVIGGPGDATGSSPYQITFGGNLGGDFIPRLLATNSLTGTVHTLAVAVVAPGGAPEVCVPGEGDVCKIGTHDSAPGEFAQSAQLPLSIDGAGNVWVGDENRVQEFSPSGSELATVALSGRRSTKGLAVNAAGTRLYAISSGSYGNAVRVYDTATDTEVGSPIDELAVRYKTFAVDASGNVYVADRPNGGDAVFRVFDASGEQVAQFGAGQVFGTGGPEGIALDEAAGTLYSNSSAAGAEYELQRFQLPRPGPLVSNQRATGLSPAEGVLTATLDPEGGETTYHFEYGRDTNYGQATATATLAPGFYDESLEVPIAGLNPSTTYHFRLVAESGGETVEGPDTTFTTLPAVLIGNEAVTDVTATEATFLAELNPLGVDASWWVEYGPTSGYGMTTAEATVPASVGAAPVGVRVTGLMPGTAYHVRFRAKDTRSGKEYAVDGNDVAFTTQPGAAGVGPPDGRAWEMVTPPAKYGRVLTLGILGDIQSSIDGSALTYITAPVTEEAQGSRVTDQVLARRAPDSGWQSNDLALPTEEIVPAISGNTYPYRAFTPDLSRALVQQSLAEETLLSSEASEQTPYLRDTHCNPIASDCFAPLVTGAEGSANVPSGTEFGRRVKFVGASEDLRNVIVSSTVPLTAEPAPEGGLYEWSAATHELRLASILPDHEAAPAVDLGEKDRNVRGAVSRDGSRVVFSVRSGPEQGLYLRDLTSAETVQLDAPQAGIAAGEGETEFQVASPDGADIFFTSEKKLVPGSGARPREADLYVCEVRHDETTRALGCALTDLTPRTAGGEPAAVRGVVAGAAEDGSRVYFVANGAFGAGAATGNCAFTAGSTPEELCNLYVAARGEDGWQAPRLIATLSTEDKGDWARAAGGTLGNLTARVSPNGRWLAFMSSRPLAGYDNRDAASGERDEEVYLYDAAADRLLCATCEPSGARPEGAVIPVEGGGIVDGQGNWRGRWLAALVPGWTAASEPNELHQPRYLTDAGRLYFDSPSALVPGDANGTWDVYQFEPIGIGDCDASSVAYSARNGGCVALISSGRSSRESAFLDASESGDDVFFRTDSALVPQDVDAAADIYDARVCTSSSPCLAPSLQPGSCGDASTCRGLVPPATASEVPGTAALTGRGNPKSHGGCRISARSARKLSHRARQLRRDATRVASDGHAPAVKGMRRMARRLAKRARHLSRRAKRCRRAGERAGR